MLFPYDVAFQGLAYQNLFVYKEKKMCVNLCQDERRYHWIQTKLTFVIKSDLPLLGAHVGRDCFFSTMMSLLLLLTFQSLLMHNILLLKKTGYEHDTSSQNACLLFQFLHVFRKQKPYLCSLNTHPPVFFSTLDKWLPKAAQAEKGSFFCSF